MWDQRYADPDYVYGTEPNDFLKETAEAHLPEGGSVLCLAEGEGRNGVFLAGLGFKVTGVDGSSVGLEKAQRLAKQRGVEIETIVSDLADFDLGEERLVSHSARAASEAPRCGGEGAQARRSADP